MGIYSTAIALYEGLVHLASRFNPKARLMLEGQSQTFDILKNSINPTEKYIWVHAASLGEFEQGRPLIERLKSEYPTCKILLTFFSPSGYEVRKNYPLADVVCYLPFDRPKLVRQFLDAARPRLAIFIKYEFWLNYLNELHRRNIPIFLVSAIFRPSQPFFKWYGSKARKVLSHYKAICVQNKASADLLSPLALNNVHVCGDTRFDRVYDLCQQAQEVPLVQAFTSNEKYRTLVAGSTWAKDEELLIPYFNSHPEVKLIIAPHEVNEEHLLQIERQLQRPFVRFSNASATDVQQAHCLIVDTIGLLSSIYRYGDVAYIGGGFGVGIHNTLEAATYGLPVVFGTNYRRFNEAVELVSLGGAFSVGNCNELQQIMDKLLSENDCERTVAGNIAGEYVRQNVGSTDRVMQLLAPLFVQ